MMKRYVFTIRPQDKEEQIHFNMGSIWHGFLIESLPHDFATYLHGETVRPYSQCVLRENGKGYWRIQALNQEMVNYLDALAEVWQKEPVGLNHRNRTYALSLAEESKPCSYKEFSRHFFLHAEPSRRIKMQFCTPTSFRANNEYQIFPTVKLILASSYRKWNALSDDVVFDDEESLAMICKDISIQRYDMKSARFALERTKIPSFVGEVELSIRGPEMTVRWVNMLLSYAAFSGVGIKTSLGMGCVQVNGESNQIYQ